MARQNGREHLESAERLRGIYQELERVEVTAHLHFPVFQKAPTAAIKLNHATEFCTSEVTSASIDQALRWVKHWRAL